MAAADPGRPGGPGRSTHRHPGAHLPLNRVCLRFQKSLMHLRRIRAAGFPQVLARLAVKKRKKVAGALRPGSGLKSGGVAKGEGPTVGPVGSRGSPTSPAEIGGLRQSVSDLQNMTATHRDENLSTRGAASGSVAFRRTLMTHEIRRPILHEATPEEKETGPAPSEGRSNEELPELKQWARETAARHRERVAVGTVFTGGRGRRARGHRSATRRSASRTSRGTIMHNTTFSSDEKRAELGSGSPGIPEACFVMALRR